MIPRTLVPKDVRPASPDDFKKNGHRRTTYMDDRTVVPSELSDAPPLDGKSKIPAHMTLEVLTTRSLVDRSMPVKPLERSENFSEFSIPQAIHDSRVVVPAYVEAPAPEERKDFEHAPEMTANLREIVEPDIFMTGDANLLVEPEAKQSAKYDAVVRTVSVIFHICVVLLLIFPPAFLQRRRPTAAELELARKELPLLTYLPDEAPRPPSPPVPKVHIDRKTIKNVTPPSPEPVLPPPPREEAPKPEPPKELPEAPKAQTPPPTTAPAVQPNPEAIKPSELQPITPPKPDPNRKLNLGLGSSSPTKALHDEMADAARSNAGKVYTPQSGGYGLPGGGGQGPGIQPGLQMLTPTQGVDFDEYLKRVVEAVRRNWFAVMPESARMGDRGIVVLTFKISANGVVPRPDPNLERTSGKDALDAAAMSSIRASSPFEPLPPQFKGPYIELRFGFFYNVPVTFPTQ
jgi:TonB family protein